MDTGLITFIHPDERYTTPPPHWSVNPMHDLGNHARALGKW